MNIPAKLGKSTGQILPKLSIAGMTWCQQFQHLTKSLHMLLILELEGCMGLGIEISRTYYTCNNTRVCLKGGSLNIIKWWVNPLFQHKKWGVNPLFQQQTHPLSEVFLVSTSGRKHSRPAPKEALSRTWGMSKATGFPRMKTLRIHGLAKKVENMENN